MDTTSDAHHFVGKYTTPAELTEHFVESTAMLKPLVVYHLLKKFNYRPALCFSASRDATHRLCLLLRHLDESLKVAECSSEISKTARDQLLKDFSNGKIDL
jgi:ATP-dependent RNA helicase DDX51/DBP6